MEGEVIDSKRRNKMRDRLRFRLGCISCGHEWDVRRRGVKVDDEIPKCRCPECNAPPLVIKKKRLKR